MKKKYWGLTLLLACSFVHADFLDGKLAYEIGDYKQAYQEFQSITQGKEPDADALYYLAWMYENGLGLSADTKIALAYYQESANLNQPQAQFALGYAYSIGALNLTQNTLESINWYKKSADNGNKDACYNLGVAYLNGIDEELTADIDSARSWFQKGADLGSAESIYALAALYYEGKGIPKDEKKAIELLTQATLMGFGQAAFYLGQLYEHLDPVTVENQKQAYYYYLQSKQMGYQNDILENTIIALIKQMPEKSVKEVQDKIEQETLKAKEEEEKALAAFREQEAEKSKPNR
ncbi:tetratricopeptide repeat protein [Neisseria sp. Ec49-e6-T10]|uniref:tetratricopeptide repeat protein n=1 Tax=Neisseria sp. Ec49-e6-T10 TaxID=3140744 RepID=UPI003EB74AAC